MEAAPSLKNSKKQTRQRNNLIKSNYERLIKEDQCRQKKRNRKIAFDPPRIESATKTKNMHNGRAKISCHKTRDAAIFGRGSYSGGHCHT